MSPTNCIASYAIRNMLIWRNPQGEESKWWMQEQRIDHHFKHVIKGICTEVGLLGLAAIATIETVAYSALALVSLIFYPVTSRPCEFFAQLLSSSSFTVVWAIANAVFYNLFYINLYTSESLTRSEVSKSLPLSLTRHEDVDYVHLLLDVVNARNLQRQLQVASDVLNTQIDELTVNLGARNVRVAEQNAEIAALNAQRAVLNAQTDELVTNLVALNMRLAEQNREIAVVNDQIAEANLAHNA